MQVIFKLITFQFCDKICQCDEIFEVLNFNVQRFKLKDDKMQIKNGFYKSLKKCIMRVRDF